jgi:curved DNA-binding protein CbpA
MRNKYPGTCYRCGKRVEAGDGHFERFRGRWRTQHATCAIENRGTPDTDRLSDQLDKLKRDATATGKRGQTARRRLRALGLG